MKKIVSLLMVIALIAISLAGCGSTPSSDTSSTTAASTTAAVTSAAGNSTGKIKIAELVGSIGSIDDRSFCQGAWEGIKQFAQGKDVEYNYYKSADESVGAYVDSITLAVKAGNQIVVAPGFQWGVAVYKAQDMYPDVKFILIDGVPSNEDYSDFKTASNVYSIVFAEQEAGFLAGYAIVKEGYKNLGFLGGMAVPAVIRYGYGFVAGADLAAQEMGLAKDSVTIKYHYVGNFDPSPENQTYAASMFSSGTDVVFACAGQVGNVVMAAAKQVGPDKKVIGVDVDQAGESDNVITSAMKNLGIATKQALDAYVAGTFPGGKDVNLTAKEDGVGLPTATASWRFKNFKLDDYNALFAKLKADENGLAKNLPTDTQYKAASDIPVKVVKVVVD